MVLKKNGNHLIQGVMSIWCFVFGDFTSEREASIILANTQQQKPNTRCIRFIKSLSKLDLQTFYNIRRHATMKGMGNMMKQAQKLQSQMMKLQEELADKTVESSSGGGMVTVVANGRQQIVSIQIEDEVVDPDDVEMLQDLVLAAVNDALAKAQEMVSSEMGKLTGGLNIPGLS
jgi:DNA-binding YbaB/EbfC family protein